MEGCVLFCEAGSSRNLHAECGDQDHDEQSPCMLRRVAEETDAEWGTLLQKRGDPGSAFSEEPAKRLTAQRLLAAKAERSSALLSTSLSQLCPLLGSCPGETRCRPRAAPAGSREQKGREVAAVAGSPETAEASLEHQLTRRSQEQSERKRKLAWGGRQSVLTRSVTFQASSGS